MTETQLTLISLKPNRLLLFRPGALQKDKYIFYHVVYKSRELVSC